MKILIVEDDIELRKELKVLLDNNGYQGIILDDFKNSLSRILEINPDLILLDIKIPYLNGQQLLKKLREVYPAIGYSNEKTIIFLAKDLVKTHRHLDETEDIEVLELPIEEVKEMLDNGEIKTSSEAVGLLNYFMYEYKK